MANGILVVAEQRQGNLKKVSLEVVGAALTLVGGRGLPVEVALLGHDIGVIAEQLGRTGVSRVLVADAPVLASFSSQAYANVLAGVVEEVRPRYVLLGFTAMSRALAPRLAARIRAGLATDCIEIELDQEGHLEVVRPVYSGKVLARVGFRGEGVEMASIRPHVYPAVTPGDSITAETVEVSVGVTEADLGAAVVETVATSEGKKDLTEAEVVVAGGRSLKSAENFKILDDLAGVLGASVGASRAAVDAGYAPHTMQIGQTGKVVNPALYMAFGISGAIQHLAGMRTSKVIVAVNKDPNAPIFRVADYGIVGDLFEIVPLLTREFQQILGG